jgi:hypothetical protein
LFINDLFSLVLGKMFECRKTTKIHQISVKKASGHDREA